MPLSEAEFQARLAEITAPYVPARDGFKFLAFDDEYFTSTPSEATMGSGDNSSNNNNAQDLSLRENISAFFSSKSSGTNDSSGGYTGRSSNVGGSGGKNDNGEKESGRGLSSFFGSRGGGGGDNDSKGKSSGAGTSGDKKGGGSKESRGFSSFFGSRGAAGDGGDGGAGAKSEGDGKEARGFSAFFGGRSNSADSESNAKSGFMSSLSNMSAKLSTGRTRIASGVSSGGGAAKSSSGYGGGNDSQDVESRPDSSLQVGEDDASSTSRSRSSSRRRRKSGKCDETDWEQEWSTNGGLLVSLQHIRVVYLSFALMPPALATCLFSRARRGMPTTRYPNWSVQRYWLGVSPVTAPCHVTLLSALWHLQCNMIRAGRCPQGRALVAGCGRGYDVTTLATPARTVVGIDISKTAIEEALCR